MQEARSRRCWGVRIRPRVRTMLEEVAGSSDIDTFSHCSVGAPHGSFRGGRLDREVTVRGNGGHEGTGAVPNANSQ